MSRFEPFSPEDFEEFVADLLAAEHGAHYEVFARGRDRGIDLRRRHDDGALEIVQVKHYVRSSFSALRAAAASEKVKVDELPEPPGLYRFVTSRPLTVSQKDELVGALQPHVTDPGRILGAEDLAQMLKRHPGVEREHPKLWLTGSTHLLDMVHADVRHRSASLVSDIEDALPTYVRHARFREARERLHKARVLIIAGNPGVGKTTLAHLLVADALKSGYDDPIAVARHTDEIRRVLDPSRAQIVLYDDFLGRTALERLDKNGDRELTAMMRQVLRSDNTLFVLTTREYILRHASQLHEELRHGGVEKHRYLLELHDYSMLDRARIFLNHAHRSRTIEPPAIRGLADRESYLSILEHKRYNPRTVAYITGVAGPGFEAPTPNGFLSFALDVLNDPGRLWRQTFQHEIGTNERALLLAVASVGTETTTGDLSAIYQTVAGAVGADTGADAFEDALHSLDDSMLRTYQDGGEAFVGTRDPSVDDYLTSHVRSHRAHTDALFASADRFEQVQWLIGRAHAASSSSGAALAADALKRVLHSASVTWWSVYFGSDPEPRIVRQEVSIARRLRVAHELMDRFPLLEPELRPWWTKELRLLLERPPTSTEPRYELFSLTRATKPWIDTLDGGRQAAASLFARHLHFDQDWARLPRIREMWPDGYDESEWARLQAECEEWLHHELTDPDDIEDLDAFDAIIDAARNMGVEVDQVWIDDARQLVEERVGDRVVDDFEPDDEAPLLAPTDAERDRIHESFARFGEETMSHWPNSGHGSGHGVTPRRPIGGASDA